jgi:DHA2 family metal-tetracycline-proton antiporter-like MFS transporter
MRSDPLPLWELADRYQLKDLLPFGLIIMSLVSFLGLVAQQYWMVVVGRMLQAAGAAVIPAISMIISVKYFTLEKRRTGNRNNS